MWWNKHKWKIILTLIIGAVLAFAFWYGGDTPGSRGWTSSRGNPVPAVMNPVPIPSAKIEETPQPGMMDSTDTPAPEHTQEPLDTSPAEHPEESTDLRIPEEPETREIPGATVTPSPIMEIDPDTGQDQFHTDPVPEDKPLPVNPQDTVIETTAYTCTISISCAAILDNMDLCDGEKKELVPEDGWILKPMEVTFYEGESVFNVFQRTCKQQRIHMEYEDTPMYNSAYIEGISNLYNFDVGELSGWRYKVNEWFPNYGSSRYQLKDGDVICWVYTCDLGRDVGGEYSAGNGRDNIS